MTTQAQKLTKNLALKVAITATGRTQRQIAKRARIQEVRLSEFVCGVRAPTAAQRAALAKAIGRDEAELFGA